MQAWIILAIILFIVVVALVILAFVVIFRSAGSVYAFATLPGATQITTNVQEPVSFTYYNTYGITLTDNGTKFSVPAGTYYVSYKMYFPSPAQLALLLNVGDTEDTNFRVQGIDSDVYTASGVVNVTAATTISLVIATAGSVTIGNQGIGGSITIFRL